MEREPGGGRSGSIGCLADFRTTSQSAASSYVDTPKSWIKADHMFASSVADEIILPTNLEEVRSDPRCTRSGEDPTTRSEVGFGGTL